MILEMWVDIAEWSLQVFSWLPPHTDIGLVTTLVLGTTEMITIVGLIISYFVSLELLVAVLTIELVLAIVTDGLQMYLLIKRMVKVW